MSVVSSFDGGVCIRVKVKPGTSRARAWRVVDIGDDKQALEIAIAAQPEGGKANKELCAQISKTLHLPKDNVTIKAGQTGRIKIVEVVGASIQDIKKAANN